MLIFGRLVCGSQNLRVERPTCPSFYLARKAPPPCTSQQASSRAASRSHWGLGNTSTLFFSLSRLPQHHQMLVLCFSHFESPANSTVFCVLAEIMYLGFLSDILNTFFSVLPSRAHSWVECLLCGRPAEPHSHTRTPRCGPRGLVLSGFRQPDICCLRLLSDIVSSNTVCLCALTSLFARRVSAFFFVFFFFNFPLSKLKLWKTSVPPGEGSQGAH